MGCLPRVSFSDDSRTVVSAEGDSMASIWDVSSGELRLYAESRPVSIVTQDEAEMRLVSTSVPGYFDNTGWAWGRDIINKEFARCYTVRCRDWVYFGGDKVIQLPTEFRATSWAALGTLLVLGCSSGAVVFIELPHDGIHLFK